MTDDDFFTVTPELARIHRWARARYAAPWAVFGAVLLRVSASVGPHVQLPGLIGGRASLNLLCAFVSASGGGKGISDKVARLAWPRTILELPIGSGEGIAATFKKPDNEHENNEAITAAIFNVPEVDTLAGIASRQGSILLAQLKSVAMGEQIGQQNASKVTSRVVAAHTYRCCLSVGAQPGHTGVIFDDTTGGTPQRFLWFPTTDPSMPSEATPDPAPLNTDLPVYVPNDDGVVEIAYGPDEIRQSVIGAHLARQRGEGEALDGHALLTRCKVAALLAILHHRSVVSALDWQLSEVVVSVSNTTRDWITTEAKAAQRAKVRDRAIARAAGDAIYDDRLLEGVKRSILKTLERDGEQAGNALRSQMGKRDRRDMFDQAVALLQYEGLVVARAVDRGARYRLSQVQGEPPVQGASPQLNKGEPKVQGEPGTNPPEPEKPSSPDHAHPAGMQPRDTAAPVQRPQTCLQWITEHVAELITDGTDTIECRPVYEAGVRAGFKIDNLRQAAKTCPLITQIGRNGSTTTIWRLGQGSGANEIVTASQWLLVWLTGREWMLAADVYTAAAQAGYSRSAIKSAALSGRIAKRGQSVATQWALAEQPPADQLSRCDVCTKELPPAATEPQCHGCGHTGLRALVTGPASKSA